MKKTLSSLCIILIAISAAFSQDDTRRLNSFSEISVSGDIKIDIYEGQPKAEIDMIKGDIDELVTEVKGNTLRVKFEGRRWGWGSSKNKAHIKLYCKNLSGISTSAGSSVEGHDLIKTKHFEADASSGSRIEVSVDAESVSSDVSSGASARLSGSARNLSVDVSSGASFRGIDLQADHVDADVSSGGSIRVWAKKSLTADASSGGSIRYKGEPEKTNIDSGKYSGGSVSKM